MDGTCSESCLLVGFNIDSAERPGSNRELNIGINSFLPYRCDNFSDTSVMRVLYSFDCRRTRASNALTGGGSLGFARTDTDVYSGSEGINI